MAEYKKIQDTEDSNFGNYDEANGGGTPVGGKFGGPNGRVGWDKRGKPGHREGQPRTEDGKFTYNSANGKELSPTSDPTRGKTVNPLLTGGKNGVMIKDVEEDFSKQSGEYWDKYKDRFYVNGSEKTGINSRGKVGTRVADEPIWEVARHSYDVTKGELGGESENWKGKAGARSEEEKKAITKQEKTGKEQLVEGKQQDTIKRKDENAPIQESEINNTTSQHLSNRPGSPNRLNPNYISNKPKPAPTAPAPSAPAQNPQGKGQFLQAPTAGNAQNQSNNAGLTPSNMNQLNALFGGSVPSNITQNAPQGPSLAGFKNFKKKQP